MIRPMCGLLSGHLTGVTLLLGILLGFQLWAWPAAAQ